MGACQDLASTFLSFSKLVQLILSCWGVRVLAPYLEPFDDESIKEVLEEDYFNKAAKGGSYINVPSIVVSMHFKSCVRQCSSTNPSSSMRPDNIREISKASLGQ